MERDSRNTRVGVGKMGSSHVSIGNRASSGILNWSTTEIDIPPVLLPAPDNLLSLSPSLEAISLGDTWFYHDFDLAA